jgi:hypothetical protein
MMLHTLKFVITRLCTVDSKVRYNHIRHNGSLHIADLCCIKSCAVWILRRLLSISWDTPDRMAAFWTPLPLGTSFHPLPSTIYFTFCMTLSLLPSCILIFYSPLRPPTPLLSPFPTYLYFRFLRHSAWDTVSIHRQLLQWKKPRRTKRLLTEQAGLEAMLRTWFGVTGFESRPKHLSRLRLFVCFLSPSRKISG